jgi:hypothetical protein
MAGYQLKLKEQRLSERKRFTGRLPGKFKIEGVDVNAKPIDITPHGLGVITESKIAVGAKATLVVDGCEMPLEVMWCEPDFAKNDQWRLGLICTDRSVNLEEAFRFAGCIK